MTERRERQDAEEAERERDNTKDLEEDELIGEREREVREKEWQKQEWLAHVRLEKEREEEDQRIRIEEEAMRDGLEKMVRELEIDRLALERLKSQRYREEKEKEEQGRRDRERLEMLRWEEERRHDAKPFGTGSSAPPRSGMPPNPYISRSAGGFFLDGLNPPFANLHMDNMGDTTGFYNYYGGFIDQNSGNTTVNITTNSNNDSAVRIGSGKNIFAYSLPSMLMILR